MVERFIQEQGTPFLLHDVYYNLLLLSIGANVKINDDWETILLKRAFSNSLDSISECNNVISRLLSSRLPIATAPSSSPALSPKEKERKPWKDCRKRNRTVSILHALFRHFKCGTAHELVLRVSENSDEFHLFLSSCLGSNIWQDTRCSGLGG